MAITTRYTPHFQTHGRGALPSYTLTAKREARHEPTFDTVVGLQKKRQVFGEQYGLIDDDLSTGDLEFAIRAPQDVFSAPR